MAKLTLAFGIILIALGAAAFVLTGSVHPTALIPAWFGLALVLCGALANTEIPGRRMLWMHIAVTLGLIGFLFPAVLAAKSLIHAHSTGLALTAEKANAVHTQLAMALVCCLFTALCVRSFISARRNRTT